MPKVPPSWASLMTEWEERALLTAMRDGVTINQTTLHQVQTYCPQLLRVTCNLHTIDNVSKHFDFLVLEIFTRYWFSMFSRSPAGRLAWEIRKGPEMQSYSPTSWWLKYEVMRQNLELFSNVETFLSENGHLAPATRLKITQMMLQILR